MAKHVFRPTEVTHLTQSVVIESPISEIETAEPAEEIFEYTGPSVDDLRQEAEAFKERWEEEKARMIAAAEADARTIIANAEKAAFDEVQAKTDEVQTVKQEAEDEARRMLDEAAKQAADELTAARSQVESIRKSAHDEGFQAGKDEGYEQGRAEVQRLVAQIHSIIGHTLEKRNEIIDESETQIINLVLLIVKKVIKVISENQKNVVINNVIQALRKLKSRGEVIIRVNLEDVKLTSEHVKDFMNMVGSVRSITVVEDASVDRGGCVLETDFGEIDARISSQLHEIEEKILDMAPIRTKGDDQEI